MLNLDLLILDGATAAAVGVSIDVVAAANRLADRPLFDLRLVGARSSVQIRGGLQAPTATFARNSPRDLVIVPGLGAPTRAELDALTARPDVARAATWLTEANAAGSGAAASCTGAFLLGQAGRLDGRQCTTSWWLVAALQRQFPACKAVADSMVVEDRGVWTAGAAFAHIDLMLAIVAREAGPSLAGEIARHLVVDQRPSQARYVIPSHLAATDPIVRQLEAYVRSRLDRRIGLGEVAASLGLTPRTLDRRIRLAIGLSPMHYVQKVRLDMALHLLGTTRLSNDTIAAKVGFADPAALYRLVQRHTGLSPRALRTG